jgi:hypothetical protein
MTENRRKTVSRGNLQKIQIILSPLGMIVLAFIHAAILCLTLSLQSRRALCCSGGLHIVQSRAAGADGQRPGISIAKLSRRKLSSPDDIRFGTPCRHPINPGPLEPPVHNLLHAVDAGQTLAPPNLGPIAARHLHRRSQSCRQIPEMLLCGGQRLFPSTVHFIREECGMDFALPLQTHKETVRAVRRLVNPADAGRA